MRLAMNAPANACLRTADDALVPLVGVSAMGRLDGLLFELTVEQHYRNTSERDIEAVYTFPLPLHAVLMAFELDLDGQRHVATAFARTEAERNYEEAIDEGNSAALLTAQGNGLHTVNVANLKPGEEAIVRYRYAELLQAHRNTVRINLPTAIAPRYGSAADAGLEGPSLPGADLLVEYPFTLQLDITGITDAHALASPTHTLSLTKTQEGQRIALSRNGFLDRDFVLTVEHAQLPATTLIARDGEGYVAIASAALPATPVDHRPLQVKFLVDCSGSMAGDSIAAARRALVQILGGLGETDHFSVTRFGSSVQHVTGGMEPADAHTLPLVSRLVQQMEADLGGTEMAHAIEATLAIPARAGGADIVLITDGEVYDVERVADAAARSGHRLFVIAIGAAPNEALARTVSERTGGACDFVAAMEAVEPAILRMFGRLRATPRTLGAIQWPCAPLWTAPLPMAIFPGDTLHLVAGFSQQPSGLIDVPVAGSDGVHHIAIPATSRLVEGDLLARMAAARRLGTLDEKAACTLAVKYQLVSPWTSLVLVAERAEGKKASTLPDTVAVPHMLAAGWGGAASLARVASLPLSREQAYAPLFCRKARSPSLADMAETADFDLLHLLESQPASLPHARRLALLDAVLKSVSKGHPVPQTLDALHALCPLSDTVRSALDALFETAQVSERTFVETLLHYVDGRLHRLDPILPAFRQKQLRHTRELRKRMARYLTLEKPTRRTA